MQQGQIWYRVLQERIYFSNGVDEQQLIRDIQLILDRVKETYTANEKIKIASENPETTQTELKAAQNEGQTCAKKLVEDFKKIHLVIELDPYSVDGLVFSFKTYKPNIAKHHSLTLVGLANAHDKPAVAKFLIAAGFRPYSEIDKSTEKNHEDYVDSALSQKTGKTEAKQIQPTSNTKTRPILVTNGVCSAPKTPQTLPPHLEYPAEQSTIALAATKAPQGPTPQ